MAVGQRPGLATFAPLVPGPAAAACTTFNHTPLARLRRKTHCYTKKLENLTASFLLYLIKKSVLNT